MSTYIGTILSRLKDLVVDMYSSQTPGGVGYDVGIMLDYIEVLQYDIRLLKTRIDEIEGLKL